MTPRERNTLPDFGPSAVRYGLTLREHEVLAELVKGKTNTDISDALCISPGTVGDHVQSIYKKTGATNRVQLLRIVYELQ